jgi:hypothetical protein
MNVLDRPLFRQAGGPAQPMPQDMMPPQGMPSQGMPEDPMMAVQNLEQQAAGQMRQVGQQYAMETMAKLDAASDPKQVIDALRGNERPLEERYAELAQYVGQEDAAATPESVLAFVQPTIMMTEEGAMDTGIGQLIQSITGDTAMSGDMGQGVGSLMMSGAQEAPAPANFRQGGPVQKFQEGGAANRAGNIRTAYEQLLPLYQDILGRTEEDKRMSKAQSYFDLAGAGLALAGGVDPRTGQSMAGAPLAAQIARAAAPLPSQFGARAAAQRDADRQIQGAALQGALSQQQADEGFMRELMLAQAKRSATAPKFQQLLGPSGESLGEFNVNDPTELAELRRIQSETPGARMFNVAAPDTSVTSPDFMQVLGDKGEVLGVFNTNNPAEATALSKMLQTNPTARPYNIGTPPTPDEMDSELKVIFDRTTGSQQVVDINTPSGKQILENVNKANADAGATLFEVGNLSSIQEGQGATFFNPENKELVNSFDGGRTYIKDGKMSDMPEGAFEVSSERSYDIYSSESTKAKAAKELEAMTDQSLDKTLRGGTPDDPKPLSTSEKASVKNAMESALSGTGPAASFAAFMDNILSVSPVDIPGLDFQDTQSNRQFLRGLVTLGRSALVVNPRFPVAEMERVQVLFPETDAFFRNPETEANKLVELKRLALDQKRRNLEEIANGISNATLLQQVQQNNFELDRLLSLLTGVSTTPKAPNQDTIDSMRSTFIRRSQLGNQP